MKLFVLILNRTEKLDDLMKEFADNHICGATIIDSMGMARELYDRHAEEELSLFGSIRNYLTSSIHKTNKTILTVLRDDQLNTVIDCVERAVGDLSEPDTGIMFTVPLDFVRGKGLNKQQ